MITLQTGLIADPEVRKALDTLVEEINKSVFSTRSMTPFEITIDQAVANLAYPHHLGFTPKDIILTHKTSGITVSLHSEDFDGTNIYITTDGPCELKGLVGRLGDN